MLNATTSWAFAKHYCTISGVSKVKFIDNTNCCTAMPVNIADHRCTMDFAPPECCEIEMIQHIGENQVLKTSSREMRESLAVNNDMIEKVKLFEVLPPVTYTPPPKTDLIFEHTSPRLAYLQVYRL